MTQLLNKLHYKVVSAEAFVSERLMSCKLLLVLYVSLNFLLDKGGMAENVQKVSFLF